MPVYPIESLNDPRLTPYRNLKEKELSRAGGRFIAEGKHLVRRLLASNVPVESVLLAERKAAAIAPLCPSHLPVYTATDHIIRGIIGFKFHSGVIACGIRPASPSLQSLIPPPPNRVLLTVCQEIANAENLGSIIRIAAAFGATGVVVGERCCDPWFRQSVRVSMGTIFALPIVQSENLLADLETIKSHGLTRIAAVVSEKTEPLEAVEPLDRVAIVLGSEAQGLDSETIERCDHRVTIPMRLGTDSLNVAVAAGIFHYHFTGNPPSR